MKKLILVTLITILFNTAYSQSIKNIEKYIEAADSISNEYINQNKLIGFSVGVLVDEQIVWHNALGIKDAENNLKPDSNTVFRLASLSKPMTAIAVLQLYEKGIIDIDQPIQKYVPDFPKKSKKDITVRQILNHTSGIKHYPFISKEKQPSIEFSSMQEAIEVFKARKLKAEPGEKFNYTSYGYTVLGALIENVTKMSFQEYMKSNVWEKAGMDNTDLESWNKEYKNKAKLYKRTLFGFKKDKKTNLSINYAGGGIQSTAIDVLKFCNAFLKGDLINPLISKEVYETPILKNGKTSKYGLGFYIGNEKQNEKTLKHPGHQSGTSCYLSIIPNSKIAVVVLSNGASCRKRVLQLNTEIMNLTLDSL